jgi:serine/threonine-protein kinase
LLKESAWKLLDGTDGGMYPFFSPDGAWIGFVAENRLRKIPAAGGTIVDLTSQTNNGFRGASWAGDGNIYYSAITSGLRRVPASGGAHKQLSKLDSDSTRAFWPQILPGGKTILFTEAAFNIDSSKIGTLSLPTGEVKILREGGFSAAFLQTPDGAGKLLYMHEASIFALPFNLSRLTAEGEPQVLLDGVASGNVRGGDFAASNTGVLAYTAGPAERRKPSPVSWLDRAGRVSPLHASPALYANPRLSPDGKQIAFTISTPSGSDIWVKSLDRDTATRLTFLPGRSDWAIWTPDSKSLLFSLPGPGDLYWVDVDGSAAPEIVAQHLSVLQGLATFSGDGKRLVFSHSGVEGGLYEVATANIDTAKGRRKIGAIEPILNTPFDRRHPAISPDGKWIAYDSLETGAVEVFVQPYPSLAGKWRVSDGGGMRPIWFRNSRELLYHNPTTSRAMVAAYTVNGAEFHPGRPELWSDTPLQGNPVFQFYDLSPDGKRLAVVDLNDQMAPPRPPTSIRFLINWPRELTVMGRR